MERKRTCPVSEFLFYSTIEIVLKSRCSTIRESTILLGDVSLLKYPCLIHSIRLHAILVIRVTSMKNSPQAELPTLNVSALVIGNVAHSTFPRSFRGTKTEFVNLILAVRVVCVVAPLQPLSSSLGAQIPRTENLGVRGNDCRSSVSHMQRVMASHRVVPRFRSEYFHLENLAVCGRTMDGE